VTTSPAAKRPVDVVTVAASFDNWYAPGRYLLSPQVSHPGAGGRPMAAGEDMLSLVVAGGRPRGGLVDVPVGLHWKLGDLTGAQVSA